MINAKTTKYLLIIVGIVLHTYSVAQTITVKQDGTGNFTTIQAAINAAWPGDTVLVWPGIYYENLNIENKKLVLGSLTLTSGDVSYRYQTIIDGHDSSSCVYVYHSDVFEINGFTLQHGAGHWTSGGSGGMRCKFSTCNIMNCVVKNNQVNNSAGGISFTVSNAFLSNTSIHHNRCKDFGGGITISHSCNIVFDSINRCSIYMNYASLGTDIFRTGTDTFYIYLDTMTVDFYDRYYIALDDDFELGNPNNKIELDVRHAYLQPVVFDLYVSPLGDNNNSGTSPDQPLKNIWYAGLLARPDSLNPLTVYIDTGTYALSVNDEWFPIGGRDYLSFKGSGKYKTVLDAENYGPHFRGSIPVKNYTLNDMSMINGNGDVCVGNFETGSLFINKNNNVVIKNILFENNLNSDISSVRIRECDNITVENCDVINGKGRPVRAGSLKLTGDPYAFPNSHLAFINCRFEHNVPPPSTEYGWTPFNAFVTYGSMDVDSLSMDIIGCLFDNNVDSSLIGFVSRGSVDMDHVIANFVNCTFADNKAVNSQQGASVNFGQGSVVNMYNSIFANNQPKEIGLYKSTNYPYYSPEVHFHHSLVLGGEDSFYLSDNSIVYTFDTTNLDTDPLFYGGPDFPYNLSDESPCIDAGTLDLPQFVLDHMPDVDLAGNPRVVNDKIDMGCYEWNPTVGTDEHRISNTEHRTLNLKAFPNPFSATTYIAAQWKKSSIINIEVYNNAGLLVKTLQSGKQLPGSCKIPWDGTDNIGNNLPSGIYYVILRIDSKEVENVKIIKL